MKVFISWSGEKSKKIALIFREWLPSIIQSVVPYVSSEDIDKGSRWSTDIANELENSSFGILCVTRDNLESPWLCFEAGALSKTVDKTLVAPFLFDVKRSEVKGPILQFQSTIFQKDDIKKMVVTLNKACDEFGMAESRLDKAFEVWYPVLESELNQLIELENKEEINIQIGDIIKIQNDKQNSEIIEEILELTRENQKLLRNPDSRIYDSINEVIHMVDEINSRDLTRKENGYDFKITRLFLKELSLINKESPNAFLIILSSFKEGYPWLYDVGKELLKTIKSDKSLTEKELVIDEFKDLIEFTYSHLLLHEFNNNNEDRILLKEMRHQLLRQLHNLRSTIYTEE